MGLVVQKYGGSSVADAEGIKRVAQAHRRHPQGRQRGGRGRVRDGRHHRRPASTSPSRSARCRRRASSTCCSPRASASRWPCWRWRSPTSATRPAPTPAARPGSSPTRRTARRGSSTSPRAASATRSTRARSSSSPASRASRRTPRRSPRSGRGGSDTTAVALGRGARRDGVRDLHRRRRGLHRRPAHRADGPAAAAHHLRGDARDGGERRQGAAPALRRVRAALRHPRPCPLVVLHAHRHLGVRHATDRRARRVRTRWSKPSSRASRTTAARPRSPSSACPTSRARRRPSSRPSRTPRSTST